MRVLYPSQIAEFGNVNFGGWRKPENPEKKTLRARQESTHILHRARIKPGLTLVGGQHSHRYAIPASQQLTEKCIWFLVVNQLVKAA